MIKFAKTQWLLLLTLSILFCAVAYGFERHYFAEDPIIRLSISSDGRYVISTDTKGYAELWDLQTQQKKLIDQQSNVYSAYFVKNTHHFMLQNWDTNHVTIQDINGNILKTFNPGFLSYGSIITSDLKYYFAADEHWALFRVDTHTGEKNPKKLNTASGLKPYTYDITEDGKYLLSIGDAADLVLRDISEYKIIRRFDPNNSQGKSFATLSPDDEYVIAGDESGGAHVWKIQTGIKIIDWLTDLNNGVCNEIETTGKFNCDKTGLILKPSDFKNDMGYNTMDSVLSIKFIDKTHYLRFTTRIPYAILYEVTNPSPLKYLPLGRDPKPAVDYYQRDLAIDTSWQTHTLVMAKENKSGILVYKYDPENQTLTKVWDAK